MMHLTYTPERQRIAIQKKGRLYQASMEYLASRGLSFPPNGKSLISSSENADVDLIYLRDDDIPEYVRRGVADFGIVGENVLAEKGIELPIVSKLGFGACTLAIAVPKGFRIKELADLEGKRIATTYPRLLSDFLKKEGVEVQIVPISGSAEITPELDLADAVCDIVQTGATLEVHGLVPVFTIMKSEAVLIQSSKTSSGKEQLSRQLNLTTI